MSIAVVAPPATPSAVSNGAVGTPRSANPGIVPTWLQSRGDQTAPPAATRAGADALAAARASIAELERAHPGVTAHRHDHGHGGGEAAGIGPEDVVGFLPGGIIVRIPSRPPVDTARIEAIIRREQERSQALVDDVRAFFDKLGVTEAEGNDDRVLVEFLPNYPNAAYLPGEDHIHIGLDPRTGRSFADGADVIAHEYAHRIVDRLSQGLALGGEDSAIHESLADTFAAAYDGDDWQIGEDLGEPIRDMANPGSIGHPAHVADLERVLAPESPFMYETELPDGRVALVPDMHVVAGIPNKAAAMIGDALGRDTMAKIYINALRDYVRPGREIEGLAEATMMAAQDLYGPGSNEVRATMDAWDAVGILDLVKERNGGGASSSAPVGQPPVTAGS